MSGRLNQFDALAPYYDRLKRFVFGSAIGISQHHFLQRIPSGARVLIIGGGSGEILPALLKEHPGRRVWYVEASSKMLGLAAARVPPSQRHRVVFIHGTAWKPSDDLAFDAVITNFVLDLMPQQEINSFITGVLNSLSAGGMWLVTDFIDRGKAWQKVLLWAMYRFFGVTCGIEAVGLPEWEEAMQHSGLAEKEFRLFFHGFIKTALYHTVSGRDSAMVYRTNLV